MLIDLAPLLAGSRGDEIPIAGVRVGESASGISLEHLTGADERVIDEERVWKDSTVFRRTAEGSLIEVPLRERIENVLAQGGWLRVGDIAISVEAGRIATVFVRGPILGTLGFRTEAAIEQQWGRPSGIERSGDRRLFHYFERRVVVGWSSREGGVDVLSIGHDSWREPQLGARELIQELMSCFDELTELGWAEPQSGSLRTRYLRIAALGRVLGLGTPRSIVEGAFLEGPLSAGRARVLEEIAASASAGPARAQFPIPTFRRLLNHRAKAEQLIRFNSGVLECSIPVLLGVMAEQERVGAALRESLSVIDGWLCRLLDPDGRAVLQAELIASFGWPDVDVRHQELEEL